LEQSADWVPVELSGSAAFRLVDGAVAGVDPFDPATLPSAGSADVVLCKYGERAGQWALICRPFACRLNGAPLAEGIRCLAHRDELVLPQSGSRLLFSNEVVATVAAHVGDPVLCPRCRVEIMAGGPIVVCPHCLVEHHQDVAASRLCWTYSEQCAVCSGPTSLDAGFTWPPEGW
jgi:hypothetical protein